MANGIRWWLAAAFTVALAAPALAQEGGKAIPMVELSGGYGFARDFDFETPDAAGENFPAGWYFSTTGNLTRWLAVVGEVAGNHANQDWGYGFTSGVTVFTAMGGPRFFHKAGRFTPYGQVLIGVARVSATVDSGYASQTHGESYPAIQPGGGVSIYFNSRIGANVAADYRRIDISSDNIGEFRFTTGIVVGFGSR